MDNSRSSEDKGSAFQIIASEPVDEATKVCNNCEKKKSLDDFHVAFDGASGRRAECKACRNIRSRVKKPVTSNDMIKEALENAAYRLLKERLG